MNKVLVGLIPNISALAFKIPELLCSTPNIVSIRADGSKHRFHSNAAAEEYNRIRRFSHRVQNTIVDGR